MMDPRDDMLRECFRQQKPRYQKELDGLSWKENLLHCIYHGQIEEAADIEKTYQNTFHFVSVHLR